MSLNLKNAWGRLTSTDNPQMLTFEQIIQAVFSPNQDALKVEGSGTAGSDGSIPLATVGKTQVVVVTPTVSASPDYSAGDSIGGKIVLANAVRIAGGTARLENLVITDKANQKPSGYILIFNADPSAATITDNAAFVMSTDLTKIIARIDVSAADYITLGTDNIAVADVPYSGRLLKSAATTSLWAAWIALSAPNLASTSDLQLTFNFSAAD